MNAPFHRHKLERFGKLLSEYRRREAKAEQSQRGWYDDDGVRQGGLIAFVRYFWHVLEPETPFVDGWPLWAICQHLESVTAGQITRLLINVPPGFCKEVHVDEMVLTHRGRVRLGDVVVGDHIVTHKGRYQRVEAVHDKGMQPTLLISTWGGRKVRAEIRHPFLTPRGWIEARNLKVGDMLAAVEPQEDLPSLVSAEEARLLGYLVGDGGVTHSPIFTNSNEEVLADFERCAESMGFSTRRATHVPPSLSKHRMKAIKVGLKGALKWLGMHGLLKKNSYTKRIPPKVLASGRVAIANFVGAYWSCDGMIRVRHKRERGDVHWSSCTTVSEGLAYDVQHALLRLGINTRVRQKRRILESKKQPGGYYTSFDVYATSHEDAVKFRDLPGLCTAKKAPLADLTLQRFKQGPLFEDEIVGLEDAGLGECRCLTVAEDHSFTANDIAVHNSLLTDVFWPAWEWGPMKKAHYRYVAFSYSASLTERDNDRFRTLITSLDYQRLYGPLKTVVEEGVRRTDGVGLRNKTTIKVMNTSTGWKLASSVGGVATGERADRVIIDDPHSVIEAESERVRGETVRWFRESISSRFNNLDTGALIIIMQRVHYDDVSGVALGPEFNYCHLMIPWSFDPARALDRDGAPIVNKIGWNDPRADDEKPEANKGEAAWPDRFSNEAMARTRSEVGPYAWSSQYEQSPVPRGEGIFKREWWQLWESADGNFPLFEYIIASLDGAFTEDEENDPSAMTVWGIFIEPESKQRRIMLVTAWRKHLQFSAPRIEALPSERLVPGMDQIEVRRRKAAYRRRTMGKWGLIEWVEDTCQRFKVDKLLIEAKASGISAAQEIQNRYGTQDFAIQLCPVKGDKVARALAVQPTFSNGMVYAPEREWAELVIEEAEIFPKGKYDDLTDSMTQALKHLRDVGLAQTNEEVQASERERITHRSRPKALYPV